MLKTVSNVTNAIGALNYQGTWNASTNTPTLVSSVGTKGDYYVVSVAGSTNLDGETLWGVGDWAVFNGSVWQKVDGGDTTVVTSLTVTGITGYMYANNSSPVTASTTIPVANVTGAVANTVYVIAGTSLSGGGALTGNVTINLANTAVTAASYGNATSVSQITVNSQGQITAAANVTISIAPSQISAVIPNSGLANSTATLGNATITLGGTTTSVGNLTLTNVTISGTKDNLVSKTAAYTATALDKTILGNASTAAFSITLPTSVGITGQVYSLKKVDSSANAVTVITTSSQTIDGQTTKPLSLQYDGIQVQSDGANWMIISNTFGRNGTAGSF